ncbi:hypothetical protein BH09ACT8_BH09ACT8_39970 [soil metagenome]
MIHTEPRRDATRLEFYLPGGRHFTLIRRGSWLGLEREVPKGVHSHDQH